MSNASKPAIAFLGLGMMGLPMATRLVEAGYDVCGMDVSPAVRDIFQSAGGRVAETAASAAKGCDIVITMLPNSDIVSSAVLGTNGAVAGANPNALFVDMSSSVPQATKILGERLEADGFALIDAPVSGGVVRAVAGTLAIMVGGESDRVETARPILECLGKSILKTGPLGSGHAVKALNNYVSASGLVAACEALIVGKAFGIDPNVLVDALNVSSGKNNSTETKLKPFVISETFGSGFAMALMAKDIRIASELARGLDIAASEIFDAAALWEAASGELGPGTDHTAIVEYLRRRTG